MSYPIQDEEPSERRGPPDVEPDTVDVRPRRRKRRRRDRRQGAEPGIVDSIPLAYNIQVNLGVGIGLALQVVGAGLQQCVPALSLVGILLIVASTLFFSLGLRRLRQVQGLPGTVRSPGIARVAGTHHSGAHARSVGRLTCSYDQGTTRGRSRLSDNMRKEEPNDAVA